MATSIFFLPLLSTFKNFGHSSIRVDACEQEVQEAQGQLDISEVHIDSDLDDNYTQSMCMNIF